MLLKFKKIEKGGADTLYSPAYRYCILYNPNPDLELIFPGDSCIKHDDIFDSQSGFPVELDVLSYTGIQTKQTTCLP